MATHAGSTTVLRHVQAYVPINNDTQGSLCCLLLDVSAATQRAQLHWQADHNLALWPNYQNRYLRATLITNH